MQNYIPMRQILFWDSIYGLCQVSVHREGDNPSSMEGVLDLSDHISVTNTIVKCNSWSQTLYSLHHDFVCTYAPEVRGLLLVRQLPGDPPLTQPPPGSPRISSSHFVSAIAPCQARLVTWGQTPSWQFTHFLLYNSVCSQSQSSVSPKPDRELQLRPGQKQSVEQSGNWVTLKYKYTGIFGWFCPRLFWHSDIMTHCFWIW